MTVSKRSRLVLMVILAFTVSLSMISSISSGGEGPYQVYTSPNWANHETVGIGTLWVYEHSTDRNTDFAPMAASTAGDAVYDSGHETDPSAKIANPWNTALFLVPGYTGAVSRNAVMAFIVPADGIVNIAETTVVRNYGLVDAGIMDSSVEIAVYLNDTKIWPEGTEWASITAHLTPANTLTVPAIEDIEVSANDKIRFIANIGEPTTVNWTDYTEWQVDIELTEAAAPVIPDYSSWNVFEYERPGVDKTDDIGSIWTYEYSTGKNTDFTPMVSTTGTHLFLSDYPTETYEVPAQAMITNPWNTVFFLAPGYYVVDEGVYESINAVLTFVSPYSGVVNIDPADVIRNYGMNDAGIMDSTVEIAVYHNNTKVWPAGADWAEITQYSDPVQTLSVPAIEDILVEEGDMVRFVVNIGEASTVNWTDYTDWPVNIKLHTLDAVPTQAPDPDPTEEVTPDPDPTETPDPTVTETPENPSTGDNGNTTGIIMITLAAAAAILMTLKVRTHLNKA